MRTLLILALLTATVHAGGPAQRRKRTSVRVARVQNRPAVIAQRNAGGRPWAWTAFYGAKTAANVTGIFGQVVSGVIGGVF